MATTSMFWDVAMYVAVFLCGAVAVKKLHESKAGKGGAGRSYRPGAPKSAPVTRPANQLPVLSFNELVEKLELQPLVTKIEGRSKLSQSNWTRDCQPIVESFAEFVQMLPASECHHHAQPGGLLVHALEVADAALTFRAGMEIPQGASTEERKRDEHRWTIAIMIGALLHDVGKPVTDTRVTLYQADPKAGTPWRPLAGPMRSFAAQAYSVAFADASERDYKAHGKLGSLLMQSMVPQRTRRWLSESGGVLDQLLEYLSGDAPDGIIGSVVKKADSDSVRRNLLHGPRTRFASARTRPLIERLMEALRRMLVEGAQLPLNRPGAAGWIYDGKAWFVCARLADAVRDYLAQHESIQGIPGKDKNDRLFDTWQEHGAVVPAPDGGAVWRVMVRCDSWAPPDPLTVLCFPLEKLYGDPAKYPAAMKGSVQAAPNAAPGTGTPSPASAASAPAVATPAPPAPAPVGTAGGAKPLPVPLALPVGAVPAAAAGGTTQKTRAAPALDQRIEPVFTLPQPVGGVAVNKREAPGGLPSHSARPDSAPTRFTAADLAAGLGPEEDEDALPASAGPQASTTPAASPAPAQEAAPVLIEQSAGPAPLVPLAPAASAAERPTPTSPPEAVVSEPSAVPAAEVDPEILAPHEAADLAEGRSTPKQAPELTLTAPLRPRERTNGHPSPPKMPSPAAQAFLAWLAQSVGSGELRYNEDGALVHFVPEGALLLSPEIFRRFLEVFRAVDSGPIFELLQGHGENAYKRLQNELAKSGFTLRNGDENLHPYQFVKADGTLSRTASFYLLRQPELLWNPVPKPNDRIKRAGRPPAPKGGAKALRLPATAAPKGAPTQSEEGRP